MFNLTSSFLGLTLTSLMNNPCSVFQMEVLNILAELWQNLQKKQCLINITTNHDQYWQQAMWQKKVESVAYIRDGGLHPQGFYLFHFHLSYYNIILLLILILITIIFITNLTFLLHIWNGTQSQGFSFSSHPHSYILLHIMIGFTITKVPHFVNVIDMQFNNLLSFCEFD